VKADGYDKIKDQLDEWVDRNFTYIVAEFRLGTDTWQRRLSDKKTSWRSIKRSSKKVLIFASSSRLAI
jgi:hypothetical protein